MHIKTSANNTVTFLSAFNSASKLGVRHTYYFHGIVNSNIVSGYTIGLTSDLREVYNADKTVGSLRCNSVINLPVGMEFSSQNLKMIWRQNTMRTNTYGLLLSGAGSIDQQGDPVNPSDNYWQSVSVNDWTGGIYHTMTDGSSFASGSPLFIRAISGFTPTNNGNTNNQILQIYGNNPGTLNFSTSNTIIPCYTLPENEFEELGHSFQAMQIVLTGDPEADEDEVSQYLLFHTLDQDTALASANDTLHEFYENNLPEAIGQVRDIEDLLATGQYTAAYSLINSFYPETNVQSNYKTFFQLYYTFMTTDSLSAGAYSDLEVLASQCPYKDGPAVYKARALLNMIDRTIIVYNDVDCISTGYSGRTMLLDSSGNAHTNKLLKHESTNFIYKSKSTFSIYPNPSDGKFKISTNKLKGSYVIQIKDICGRILFTKIINNQNNSQSHEFDLLNGIYFVSILGSEGILNTKKLIISK